jgi:fatty acid desaturase 6
VLPDAGSATNERTMVSNGLAKRGFDKKGSNEGENEVYDYVKLKDIPRFAELNEQVQRVVEQSSWFDQYGMDWLILFAAIAMCGASLVVMQSDVLWKLTLGMAMMGFSHSTIATKTGHSAGHGTMSRSPLINKILTIFSIEMWGSFSEETASNIHIKTHHPHTNIIGLGDSSTWKVPSLSTYNYMFFAPMALPIITPLISIGKLWGQWRSMIRYIIVASFGFAVNFWLLMQVSGFSLWGAVACTFMARAVLSIPYIHVNIFQHIGLPMYSQKSRPVRLYQMTTGVLNLGRNPLLDWTFGHSIISCHVEHHLFPKLSDNMCLKVKPVVSKWIRDNGLTYNEDSYYGRLKLFVRKYDTLMVNAPPITHFVGLQ